MLTPNRISHVTCHMSCVTCNLKIYIFLPCLVFCIVWSTVVYIVRSDQATPPSDLYYTVHTVCYTLYTAHFVLHTVLWTLHTSNYTLYTTLHYKHYKSHSTLLTAHCTLHQAAYLTPPQYTAYFNHTLKTPDPIHMVRPTPYAHCTLWTLYTKV